MKCDYCGKKIKKDDCYGVLGSVLIHHEECYSEAFRSKSFRARKFRIKNNILYKWNEFKFLLMYIFLYNSKKVKK